MAVMLVIESIKLHAVQSTLLLHLVLIVHAHGMKLVYILRRL